MHLAIDHWRLTEGLVEGEGADAAPLALISETAHGPRIIAVNAAGLTAGVQAGMRLADARVLCPQIATAPSDPAGDLAFLEELALWAQRWGPWSALDLPDGLIIDVTGVSHLFGGEAALIADVQAAFANRRLAVRAAIAPTAGAAWALSHFASNGAILGPQDDAIARLANLPVAALRLDDDILLILRRLGLKRVGELHGVARQALFRRFRKRHVPATNPLIRLDQLLGKVPEPLLPVLATQAPLAQRRLMEPVRHRDLLERVVIDLAVDIARQLDSQALGARRLELSMWKVDGGVVVRCLELSAPSRDPRHIAELMSGRLEGLDAGFGIEFVRLRCLWVEPLKLTQNDFEAATETNGTSLAACIDRLSIRLGPKAVRRPVPHASHIPERAQRWQEPLEFQETSHKELELIYRPLKLLDNPEKIGVLYASPDGFPRRFRWRDEVHEIARIEGPERIAPEWWRERSAVRLRDYYRIEDREGRRYWIYRNGIVGDGRGGAPQWFLQGLCA